MSSFRNASCEICGPYKASSEVTQAGEKTERGVERVENFHCFWVVEIMLRNHAVACTRLQIYPLRMLSFSVAKCGQQSKARTQESSFLSRISMAQKQWQIMAFFTEWLGFSSHLFYFRFHSLWCAEDTGTRSVPAHAPLFFVTTCSLVPELPSWPFPFVLFFLFLFGQDINGEHSVKLR